MTGRTRAQVHFDVARALCAGAAVALLASVPASAQTSPVDSLRSLRAALARASAVRVRTPYGASVERKVEVLADGLRLRGQGDPSVVQFTPEPVSLLGWDQIRSVEIRRGRSNVGMLAGATLGFVIGSILSVSAPERAGPGADHPALYMGLGAATGAAAGSIVGSRLDPWTVVWPESP